MTNPKSEYDVVVIGGGAAGLAAGLTLGRSRRSVVVFDDGTYRNAPADGVHNYLGREGTPPAELYAIGRAEVEQYGGDVVSDRVESVARAERGFTVRTAAGQDVHARRLLFATGLHDELPDIPGIREGWGTRVLHCPYCHGWEVRDRRVGIVATSPLALHAASLWPQWTPHVMLFTNETLKLGDDEYERLAARGVTVAEGEVVAVGDDGVHLASGSLVPVDAVVVTALVRARAELLEQLGVTPVPFEMNGSTFGTYIPVNAMTGATEAPGVYAAGNVTGPQEQVITSAAAGMRAASMINFDLVTEDTDAAVAARR